MNDLPDADRQLDAADERVESYLDELLLRLRGRPRDARRLLSEVDSHLRESIEAGLAAGLGKAEAVDEALSRLGPPSAAACGLPSVAVYRAVAAQIAETALLVISALLLVVGAAALPTAILGLAGNPDLVTGDPSRQALASQHVQEVIRNHLLTGWLGFLALAAWWLLHVHRKAQPALLPAGFSLTVCGTLLGAVSVFLLAFGIADVAHGIDSTGGVIGSGDLIATGATMMTAALLAGALLARQAGRPARNLTRS